MSRRDFVQFVGIMLALLVVYYVTPWPGPNNSVPDWIGVVFVVVGIIVLGTASVWLLRSFLNASSGSRLRLRSLAFLLVIVVFFFASAYFVIAQDDGQFSGLETRTDALYFTVTVLSTTGFGDIVATSEWTRALVTLHMSFNLVFVAAIATTLGAQIRHRAIQRHESTETS